MSSNKIRKYNRIVALIDMDCFYCQVEEVLNPALKGKPIVEQPLQYDDYGGGGIISLNYVAKARGVKRSMRGDEARKQCPEIELIRVPVIRGKADLSKYRNEGKRVADVLQTFSPLITKASVDEAYLDITDLVRKHLSDMNQGKFTLQPEALQNTFAVGYDTFGKYVQHVTNKVTQSIENEEVDIVEMTEIDRKDYKESDIKLLVAASVVNNIRATVKEKTGYECSAGIAHNKMMAKLVCGMNKPNKQTIIPLEKVQELFRTLSIRKIQGLGGKFGDKVCEELQIQFMAELIEFPKDPLQRKFNEKNGEWLYSIARGIDNEAVTPKLVSKSIACSKMFPRQNALTSIDELMKWLHEIASDVADRIEQDEAENNRRPKQMTLNFTQTIKNADVASSRTVGLSGTDEDSLVNTMLDVLKKNTATFFKANSSTQLNNSIKYLGLSIGKFEDLNAKKKNTIQNLFQKTKCETIVSNSSAEENDRTTLQTASGVGGDDLNINHPECFPENVDSQSDIQDYSEFEEVKNNSKLDSSMPSTSSATDKTCSVLESKITKIECDQCGKDISENELQVHLDGHLAFLISQEQSSASTSENKTKRRSSPPALNAKKAKNSQKNSSMDSSKLSIERFLVKPSQVEVSKCKDCGRDIPVDEMFEHMDFHAAKALQDELLKSETKPQKNKFELFCE